MSERSNQRTAYFNGKYVPEREVQVPFRDRSFLYGDGCFDMTRTFAGKPFRVKEHIDRFYRSLAYLQIDIGLKPAELIDITHEVVKRNAHLLAKGDDWWVGQRVSRGVKGVGEEVDLEGRRASDRSGRCAPSRGTPANVRVMSKQPSP